MTPILGSVLIFFSLPSLPVTGGLQPLWQPTQESAFGGLAVLGAARDQHLQKAPVSCVPGSGQNEVCLCAQQWARGRTSYSPLYQALRDVSLGYMVVHSRRYKSDGFSSGRHNDTYAQRRSSHSIARAQNSCPDGVLGTAYEIHARLLSYCP